MPQYILLIKAGPFASLSMIERGREGAEVAKRNLTAMGAENIQHYAVTGEYDLVLIANFADDATALAAGLQASTDGFQVEQLRAYSMDELDQARQKLESLDAEKAPSQE